MKLWTYARPLISLAQILLLPLFVTVLWLPSPERDTWTFLLIPAFGVALSLMVFTRRIYGQSRFYLVSGAFIALCIISIYTSPYQTRGWVLLFRPLAGIWILGTLTDIFSSSHGKRWIIWLTGALILTVLLIGIGGLNWTGKASRFSDLTILLPQWQSFWWWSGGLNVNEYSGGATWILPTLAGLCIQITSNTLLRVASGAAAIVLAVIIFLSQSLSGIAGAIAGLLVIFVPQRYFRSILIAAGLLLVFGNLAILLFPAQSANLLAEFSGRPDINSLEHRSVMWRRAQLMIFDQPFTGVGIAMYRQLREEYATPGYEQFLVPHPHNEALQFGTDLGIPGLVLYGWLALTVAQAASHVVIHGSSAERAVAIAVTAGLIGHAFYALTDAIPIWDRFAFVFWWWLGLLSGLDARVSARQSAPVQDTLLSA